MCFSLMNLSLPHFQLSCVNMNKGRTSHSTVTDFKSVSAVAEPDYLNATNH